MPIPANLQNTGGYSSGNANNSYTSGGQGQTAKKGQLSGPKSKAKPLQMADFKKFKKLKNIEDRYLFGKTLG
jgi:hypothetical protein